MTHVERSALVLHSAESMFDIVEKVEEYPAFLPWCHSVRLLHRGESEVAAELEILRGGLRQKFSTRNQFQRPLWMTLTLEDGPFSQLSGEWRFTQLGDVGCRVDMVLDFDFNSRLLENTVGKVFASAADRMVEAFCARADQLAAAPGSTS